MTYVTAVHCYRCGKTVSGVDPEMGLVVRAHVECPECLVQPRCMNCGRVFTTGDRQFLYQAFSLSVGPFCVRCEGVIEAAKAVLVAPPSGAA